MVREVITINVGRCGIQMGHRIWKQYCAEAAITKDGRCLSSSDDIAFEQIFSETKDGKYRTRNLMVDTEAGVIENIRKSAYSGIYDDDCFVFGNESANNNFAKAHYILGPEMMDKINDRLRKEVEDCSGIQGFIINHSVGGGTGSGLGVLILERIAVDYFTKFKVCPSKASSLSRRVNAFESVRVFLEGSLGSKYCHLRRCPIVLWIRIMRCWLPIGYWTTPKCQ